MSKYINRQKAEEHMNNKYDPLSKAKKGERPQDPPQESPKDCPEATVLISVDDFYDLLMEQQEQM